MLPGTRYRKRTALRLTWTRWRNRQVHAPGTGRFGFDLLSFRYQSCVPPWPMRCVRGPVRARHHAVRIRRRWRADRICRLRSGGRGLRAGLWHIAADHAVSSTNWAMSSGIRCLGHRQTRFRLVPQLSDAPISDHPHRRPRRQVLFVALMGPGFLPGADGSGASGRDLRWRRRCPRSPPVSTIFAVTCGTVNFISLLPFWPLDGGRCARIAAAASGPPSPPRSPCSWPRLSPRPPGAPGRWCLLVLAGIGVLSLLRGSATERHPLHPDTGVVAWPPMPSRWPRISAAAGC